ncbi:MAG TPA: DUF72 domain-containing protein [Candidatus Hypogeohydataceae bacterium YC38]|nr:DUF72 domain-containing protein [Candidatus Brocadiales bacterium]
MTEKIRVGCCGFPVAKERYYQNFSVVELQQTFYQLPLLKTAKRWAEEAPEGFEFNMKASQLITHETTSPTYRRYKIPIPEEKRARYGSFRHSEEVMEAWEQTREIAQALKARIILFQCPPKFTPIEENKKNLRKFFRAVSRSGFLFVWEPRGEWQPEEVKRLCEELDLLHGLDPFKAKPLHGRLKYFRLHGKTDYTYRFSQEDLLWLKDLCKAEEEVYCMFNNISMFEDAQKFRAILEG